MGLRQSNLMRSEFEQMAAPWFDGLYASALRLTRNDRDAEDLVQDAVMRAYRFFDKFERGTNIKAWLFKILTNTFINRYRRKVKERSVVEGSEREAVHERFVSRDATDFAANPEQYFFDRLLSDDVLRSIDALPIDFRLVVPVIRKCSVHFLRLFFRVTQKLVRTDLVRRFRDKLVTDEP